MLNGGLDFFKPLVHFVDTLVDCVGQLFDATAEILDCDNANHSRCAEVEYGFQNFKISHLLTPNKKAPTYFVDTLNINIKFSNSNFLLLLF